MNWHNVQTWRNAGVDAKWGKIKGRPCLFVRPSHTRTWCLLDRLALNHINTQIDNGSSIKEAVDATFALVDIFSIPAESKRADL